MFSAVCAALVIAGILLAAEYLQYRKVLSGEFVRKFAHIGSGTFIAFLPFWMAYRWIAVLAVGFIVVNVFNHYFSKLSVHAKRINNNHIRLVIGAVMVASGSHAINSVKRRTWGDVLFGLAVLACALVRPHPWIFAAAILHVALADGFAAIAGVAIGKHHGYHYKVFGATKTFIGTWTFILVSFVILSVVLLVDPGFVSPTDLWPLLIWTPPLLAVIENIGIYGLDNFLLPVATLAMLQALMI